MVRAAGVNRLKVVVAVLLVAALSVVVGRARASDVGITVTRIDVTLDIPNPETDEKLNTKHTVVVYAQSSIASSRLPLGIAPTVLTATDALSGQTLPTAKRVTDEGDFTDVTLPVGTSQVKIEFSQPLFESAAARFWWDETEARLLWPCSPTSSAVPSHGVAVTSITPLSFGRPQGATCVSEAGRMKCTRWFAQPEVARCKASTKAKEGLLAARVPETSFMPFVVSGGQIALWCVLLAMAAAWRLLRPGAPTGKARVAILVRTALALILFVPCVVGYALLIDGDTDAPLTAAMSWACGVYGASGLILSQLANKARPIRTKIGQLAIVAGMPLSLAPLFVAANTDLPLWIAGVAAAAGLGFMYGESED